MKAGKFSFYVLTMLIITARFACATTPDVWFVEDSRDAQNKQWCALQDRKKLDAVAKEFTADSFGSLTYAKGHLSEIEEATDVEGDLMIYESYFLNAGGDFIKFQRRSDIYQFGTVVVEDYVRDQGYWKKVSTGFVDRDREKPVRKPKLLWWPYNQPIRHDMKEFPFFPLIGNPAIKTADRVCIAEK